MSKWTDYKKIQERAKKYGCDGKCYIDGCCSNIDTCPETRFGEFLGLIGALLFIVSLPILTVVLVISALIV